MLDGIKVFVVHAHKYTKHIHNPIHLNILGFMIAIWTKLQFNIYQIRNNNRTNETTDLWAPK